MTKMMKMARLVLAIEGVAGVRVCPHKTDKAKLVLKSPSPEAAVFFCAQMGIEPGKSWTGSNFRITEVDQKAFQDALPAFLASLMEEAR
jgi:hypothetical protein